MDEGRAEKKALTGLLESDDVTAENLFKILRAAAEAEDGNLPDTGVGLERERLLSPIFIETPIYRTRRSTVLLIDKDGASAVFHIQTSSQV